MASVVLNGVTYTDDANASTGMANGGHRVRFVPCLANFVAEAATQLALQHASRDAADASEAAALASELAAAASALSAVNAPGTGGTSTTSLTVGSGSKTFTTQTGKSFVVGQTVSIAYTTNANIWMRGIITDYNISSGSMTVTVKQTDGTGTYTAWTIGLSVPGWLDLKLVGRISNTPLGSADSGRMIDVTAGAFTQTIDAAASLGSGWWCYYRNRGTNTIPIYPNGSETIDLRTSGSVKAGMSLLIQCDGSAFTTMRLGPTSVTEILTSGTSWVCPLGVRRLKVRMVGGGGGGGGSLLNGSARYGGGGGGYCERFETIVPGTTCSYTIGAAGSGGSGAGDTDGTNGGASTWTNTVLLTAGGGLGGTTDTHKITGGGATGPVDCILRPGENAVIRTNNIGSAGSDGGDSAMGLGGRFKHYSSAGALPWHGPSGYGAGGAGPGYQSTGGAGSTDGQAGTAGVIILEY